jgi:hypothetical protein
MSPLTSAIALAVQRVEIFRPFLPMRAALLWATKKDKCWTREACLQRSGLGLKASFHPTCGWELAYWRGSFSLMLSPSCLKMIKII